MSAMVERAETGFRRFKPYPEYKDAGVEWLGVIPAAWSTRRLKFVANKPIKNGIGEAGAYDEPGWPRYVRITDIAGPRSLRDDTFKSLPPDLAREAPFGVGDILLAAVGATFGKSYLHRTDIGPVCFAGYLVRFSPGPAVDAGYAAYWTESAAYWAQVQSRVVQATIQNFSAAKYRELVIPLPSTDEQRAIAAFLDREMAKIDALTTKKERLIELLQEKRSALIEGAVRGDLADRETRLGYYVDLLPGYAFASAGFSHDPEDVRLLRGVNISPGAIRWEDTVHWRISDSARFSQYRLKKGDLVFGMDRPWIGSGIRVAEVSVADVSSLLLQRVARLRAKPGLSQRYLQLILSSPQFRSYFEPILTGISVPHVSPDQILSFRLRLPERDVQEATYRRVQEEMVKIESMSEVLKTSFGRLKELRTTLISAAVTGKIDVRDAACENDARVVQNTARKEPA